MNHLKIKTPHTPTPHASISFPSLPSFHLFIFSYLFFQTLQIIPSETTNSIPNHLTKGISILDNRSELSSRIQRTACIWFDFRNQQGRKSSLELAITSKRSCYSTKDSPRSDFERRRDEKTRKTSQTHP